MVEQRDWQFGEVDSDVQAAFREFIVRDLSRESSRLFMAEHLFEVGFSFHSESVSRRYYTPLKNYFREPLVEPMSRFLWLEGISWEEYRQKYREVFESDCFDEDREKIQGITFVNTATVGFDTDELRFIKYYYLPSYERGFRYVGEYLTLKSDNDERLSFAKQFHDQLMYVVYNNDGQIVRIKSYPGVNLHLNGFHDSWNLEFKGASKENGVIIDPRNCVEPSDFTLQGRKVVVWNRDEEVELSFHDLGDEEILDYKLTIPKKQEIVEVIDHSGKDVSRFVWEDELVPEQLRRNPISTDVRLDDAWKRADFMQVLGIRIEKNPARISNLDL